MTLWDFINQASAWASVITFPITLATSIGLFIAWASKVARVFVAIAIIVTAAIWFADISVRAAWFKPELIDVHDQIFQNTRVLLDGHVYRHCMFRNVTFVVNGTARSELRNSKVEGTYTMGSDDPKINTALLALNGLNLLKVGLMGPDGKIIPVNPKD